MTVTVTVKIMDC